MSFFKEMEGASFCQLVQWWNTDDAPEWAESSELFLSEIAYALVQHGERGAAFLKKYTKSKDIDKRVSAIWVLADNKFIDETILEDIRDAFYSDNNKLKNAALWSYIHIGTFPLPRIEIEQMMKGTDERMAALAMVYLSYACPCETVEILREALTSSNPRQREYACDVVGDNNIIELKSYVAELLNDACKDVQDSARINLELLHE